MPQYPTSDANENGGRLQARLALVVLGVALVVANLPSGAQDGLAAALRGSVLRPFLAIQEGLVSARARAEEASVLQGRIDSLTARVVSASTLEEENRRLRGLLELSGRMGPQWQAVQVLRPGTEEASILIVDRGVEDGVLANAPLITREGLAGKIRESSATQAVGMDWTHPDFSASAMTRDGLHFGFVSSERGLFQGQARLILDGVPYYAQVDSGAVIVTSGLGGTYPRGIPIGRVVELEEAEGDWRKSYWLEPFVEAGSVTLALVGLPGLGPLSPVDSLWSEAELLRADEREARRALLEDSLRIYRDSLEKLYRIPRGDTGEGR